MDPRGLVVELNEAGREILRLARDGRGERFETVLDDAPTFRALVADVLEKRSVAGRRDPNMSADRRAGIHSAYAAG